MLTANCQKPIANSQKPTASITTQHSMKKLTSLFALIFTVSIAMAQPSNDECTGVIDLGIAPICPFPAIFNNVGATPSVVFSNAQDNIPSCFSGGVLDRDVWFCFTVPADGSIVNFTVELTGVAGSNGPILQPQVAAYRGDCEMDGLDELFCATSLIGEPTVSLDLINLLPGSKIFLRISDWSLSAQPSWGDFELCIKELEPIYNIGDATASSSCLGTLYDSGGPDGDYSSNENNSFTVCPQEFTQCIAVNIVELSTEDGYDYLTIFAGENTNGPALASFDGYGGNVYLEVPGQCVTFQFESDNSSNDSGFELTWQCSADACTIAPPSTCSSPTVISSLPYAATDLTTCNAQNALELSPCNDNDWLQGEDVVFTYNSPGDECISIQINGSNGATAVGIFDDCPELATECIAVDGGESGVSDPSLPGVFLENPDTYYIVVDNPDFCTPFHIAIEQTTCPVVLPSAGYCEDALSFNGCGSLPAIVTIAPGTGDPDFIDPNINEGCWSGFPAPNFTFFYFQAQVNGEFAFIVESANPNEASDIDFQVWGPINDFEDICQYSKTNMPIRSSFANGAGPTGMANIHPFSNIPVTDVCENAFNGDDFVDALPVQVGEYYLVLINDYGNDIESGEISINFSGVTQGVLDAIPASFSVTQDTVVCAGDSVQLLASGGELYQWLSETGLSCQYCPAPIATVTQSTTFNVAINTLCAADTLDVAVEVLTVDAGTDTTICLNQSLQLSASSNAQNMSYQWTAPAGFLSCTNCQNPVVVTGIQAGSFSLTVSISGPNCSSSDEMTITVLPSAAPIFEISEDQSICEGSTIDIGGTAVAGVSYAWSSQPPGFTADQSNPSVAPEFTTTYYLQASNGLCPIPSFDSLTVTVLPVPTVIIANDTSICLGQSVQLGSTNPESGVNYQWSPASSLNTSDIANPLATPNQNTVYELTVDNGICPSQTYQVAVNVIQTPVLEFSADTLLCGLDSIQLFAQATEAGGTYLWSNGSTVQQPFIGLEPGTNTISVSYTTVCGEILHGIILVELAEGIEVDILNEQDTVYQGAEIVLMAATNFPAISYQWSNGSTADTAVVFPFMLPNDTYIIKVSDALGCTDTDTVSFTVLEPKFDIPNAFSPNGDDLNNVFKVVILGDNIKVVSMSIWNRWGNLVYQAENNNDGWDGMQDGKDAASDVYIYRAVIQLPDGTNYVEKGDLTLLR